MEDREEEEEYDNSGIQEHGPELWFTNWERQCLSDSEQREQSEAEADNDQRDKLWHLFQTSATAVAQLYKDPGCHHHHHHHHHQQLQQQGASLWVPFQSAATAVTNLYKESTEARQRSFDLGLQRRNKDVLSWAKKRRRTIRREDLIGFLCGKAPPLRSARANSDKPRPADPSSVEAASSAGTPDLQTFKEAVALQALSGAMAGITVCSGGPQGSPNHGSRGGSGWGGARKRSHTQCGSDVFTHTPTHKRSRI